MRKERVDEYQPLLVKDVASLRRFPNRSLLLAAGAACIGGTFQYGYNISIINGPTMYVHRFINQTWIERYNTSISENVLTLLWSAIVSIFTLGGLVGASLGGTLSVKLGRKGALLTNNAFSLTAALLMGISQSTGLFELLIIGRFFCGINAGIAICVQPLYLGEIAPTALRGAMGMGTSVFITGGILTGQVMGLREVLGREEYWPILLSTTCIPAIAQLIILPFFPESPRYLLIDKGDTEGCKKALKQLHGAGVCEAEREDIEKEKLSSEGVQAKKPWELFSDRSVRWQLLTIILLNAAQQLNGINAIYFYADYVFRQSGIPEDKIRYVTVGTGACECLTALTCGMLIECLGRKALIMGGYSLMSICCIFFTLTLSFQDASPIVPYLSMACVFAFILSFGLGPGGVTNILTTELFTQSTRPAAYMVAGTVNWCSFFFIGLLFPFIVLGLQQYCFLVFLVVCILVVTYIFLILPETKNKTFLEIQNEFQSSKNKKCNSIDGAGTKLLTTSI
ncbi:solute carrier family 2, facilitated glucose transporter member 11b isoform X1 [Periophthalmus magnuspinnatus]|uniref:solute carrier family 2, facilitated glucose transporter member 11b isoform X1 n=1 Tax=Periophthalmus magnuspinnatus TaxID=409849 RepID=UPI00145A3539|nr:solute carrier family 2, facilitated glucose transporter member 11b isoform X1 [Periophthalmus magnuspinnatus]